MGHLSNAAQAAPMGLAVTISAAAITGAAATISTINDNFEGQVSLTLDCQ